MFYINLLSRRAESKRRLAWRQQPTAHQADTLIISQGAESEQRRQGAAHPRWRVPMDPGASRQVPRPRLACAPGPRALWAHCSAELNRKPAVMLPGPRYARPRGSVREQSGTPGPKAHTARRCSAPRPRPCARAQPAISVSHWAPRPTQFLRRTARPKERRLAAGRGRGVALRSARRRSAPRWLAAPRWPRPGWLAGRGLGGRPG